MASTVYEIHNCADTDTLCTKLGFYADQLTCCSIFAWHFLNLHRFNSLFVNVDFANKAEPTANGYPIHLYPNAYDACLF